jgi:hypothetical protein
VDVGTVVIALDEQERAEIIRLYQRGLSVAEVSEITGPSTTWIRELLHTHGVVRSRREACALRWRRTESEQSIMRTWDQNQISVGRLIELLAVFPPDRDRRGADGLVSGLRYGQPPHVVVTTM